MPDTAVAGTAHEAETAQLPQSIRPVGAFGQAVRLGLRERRDGLTEAISRAPFPP